MNRDRKDPVTLAFGVLLVALLPTFFPVGEPLSIARRARAAVAAEAFCARAFTGGAVGASEPRRL